MKLALEVGNFVRTNNLGSVVAAETGFKIANDPDTVRAPDVGFISASREPDPRTKGFAALAPDLVVEVLSPDDRPPEVLAKTADWLGAGTRLVWIVDPELRVAHVYRADGSVSLIDETASLDGENVLPRFTCPLSAVL